MREIVTDPFNDYVYATNFSVLGQHLNDLITQACHTHPPIRGGQFNYVKYN